MPKESKYLTVHPSRQAIYVETSAVLISEEYFSHLKRLETSELDDFQLKKLAEARIKAAVKVIISELPRYVEATSSAGVRFRTGFEDVIAKALAAAERANTKNGS